MASTDGKKQFKTEKDGETSLKINETLPYKEIAIKDKYKITYISCLIIGMGSLLPYTCLLSSRFVGYYNYIFNHYHECSLSFVEINKIYMLIIIK